MKKITEVLTSIFLDGSRKIKLEGTEKIVEIILDDLFIKAILYIDQYKDCNRLVLDDSSLLCKSRRFKMDDFKAFRFATRKDKRFISEVLKRHYFSQHPEITRGYL